MTSGGLWKVPAAVLGHAEVHEEYGGAEESLQTDKIIERHITILWFLTTDDGKA